MCYYVDSLYFYMSMQIFQTTKSLGISHRIGWKWSWEAIHKVTQIFLMLKLTLRKKWCQAIKNQPSSLSY